MTFNGERNTPTDSNIPRHMLCIICGRCSTAINAQNICWRHFEYNNGDGSMYYLGKLETNGVKDLPVPAKND